MSHFLLRVMNIIIYFSEQVFQMLIMHHFTAYAISHFRNARKDYINAKYIERKYARKKYTDNVTKLQNLCEAVRARDIFGLVQVYADGVDLTEKIPLANGHVCTETFW